jgi:hypothetical protein
LKKLITKTKIMNTENQKVFTLEEMKECWIAAQMEMHKCFSSSYVSMKFIDYLKTIEEAKETKEQINRLV